MQLQSIIHYGSGLHLRDNLGNLYTPILLSKSKGKNYVTYEIQQLPVIGADTPKQIVLCQDQEVKFVDSFTFHVAESTTPFQAIKTVAVPQFLNADFEGSYYHIDTIVRASDEDVESLSEAIKDAAMDIAEDSTHLFTLED